MIELKEVSKLYRSKKGSKTVALDHVSLKFDETGMTFILGKSGSGKSTLLNIIGGLDKYDAGDMLIMGKSSKEFSKADFDSYRNTYIGFVFQDFNILEDYDVYENIVLALQLQKKKVRVDEINTLLKKLELEELKHRKVNELSGGQKQRVAIARALIKNPKIILADEPTGNLDSATGKQVMELLKEISKEKLVILVSHDHESARQYGDRIIEIQDGNVIGDTGSKQLSMSGEQYRIIKSKLPLKESFKLGVGSLKHKKIKLFFTIVLTMCALLFLSIMDTLSTYDVEKAHSKLLSDKKEQFIQIEKYRFERFDQYDFVNKEQLELKEADEKLIEGKLNQVKYPIYKIQEGYGTLDLGTLLQIKQGYDFNDVYSNLHGNPDIVVANDLTGIIKETVIGRMPTTGNEIVISNFVADLIMVKGATTYEDQVENEFMTETVYQPKSYEELVNSNRHFYFGSKGKVTIVGIVNFDLSKFEGLKEKKLDQLNKEDRALYHELTTNYANLYNKIFVHDSFFAQLSVKKTSLLNMNNNYHLKSETVALQEEGYYVSPAALEQEISYYDGTTWKKTSHLAENEMLLNIRKIKGFDPRAYKTGLEAYLERYPEEDKATLEKKYFVNYVKDYQVIGKTVSFEIFLGRSYNPDEPDFKYDDIKIIGLVGLETVEEESANYFSMDLVGQFKINAIQKVGYLVPMTNQKDFETVLKEFPYDQELSVKSTYSEEVNSLVRTIFMLKDIAFWVSIVLVVFTVFLIGNFIITSIHYRKKEIGVLRALGSRSADIIKIFIWEGLVVSLIAATLASILLIFVTTLLNNVIMAGTSLLLTPFILGIRQFVMIYLLVFVVTIISSIIPSLKIARMKPIDAILNK